MKSISALKWTAEAFVAPFHLHSLEVQYKKEFWHSDPLFRNNAEAEFYGIGRMFPKGTSCSSPCLPNGITMKGFLPPVEMQSQVLPSPRVP